MADQTLVNYIRQTLASGFHDQEIKKTLAEAGWSKEEINAARSEASHEIRPQSPILPEELAGSQELPSEESSFFTRHRKALIVTLVVIVALPLLAYGGFVAYQNYTRQEPAALKPPPEPESKPPEENQELLAQKRDTQRLKDIDTLQNSLAAYFQANQSYPKDLTDLLNGFLSKLPSDPLTNQLYLYTPLGDPPLHYSLSFILETDIGTLSAGLQVVSSEITLPVENIQNQDQTIRGKTSSIAGELEITDLSTLPFYPQEEVSLKITPPRGVELVTATLVMDDLDLTDRKAPFSFSFTAPAEPGEYQVRVFAFDKAGQSYGQTTRLLVSTP